MVSMTITGVQNVTRNLRSAQSKIRSESEFQMSRAQTYLADYIARNKLSGQTMKRRTGNLAASIRPGRREWLGARLTGVVGSNLTYARIHEEGGVIRPRKAKYLTIPVGKALTAAGVVRKPYRQWSGLELRPRKGKPGYVALKDGAPVWVLVKQVNIPARPYFAPAAVETAGAVKDIIGNAVPAIVEAGSGL